MIDKTLGEAMPAKKSPTTTLRGSATTIDGERVSLSETTVKEILRQIDREKSNLERDMPTTKDAINAMQMAKTRLDDLGWRPAIYCPKDGSEFAIIKFGSSGIFQGCYIGEWPTGHIYTPMGSQNPSASLFKPLNELSHQEQAHLELCKDTERKMFEREMKWIETIIGATK